MLRTRAKTAVVAWFTLFFLCVGCAMPAYAASNDGAMLLNCDDEGCKKPSTGGEDSATHIAFTIKNGKLLLTEVKTLRTVVRAKDALEKRKAEIKEREIGLYAMQLKQAEKTVAAQAKANASLHKSNQDLAERNQKLSADVAKYRGERYKFMLIGFGIGAGVIVLTGVAVAVVLATNK